MKSMIKNRVTAFVMSLAIVFAVMPLMTGAAYAETETPDAMTAGASVLSAGANTIDAKTIYMADKTWRVIGYGGAGVASSADTIALISSGNLKTGVKFSGDVLAADAREYSKSILKTEIDAVASTFPEKEKAGIVPRTLLAGTYDGKDTDCIEGDPVENALLWPLSTKEANAMNNSLRMVDHLHQMDWTSYWWLRSPGNIYPSDVTYHYVAAVKGDGEVPRIGFPVTNEYGVRPAFNYDIGTIVLTSKATGGKSSGEVGADALTQVGTNDSGEWKLTVKDTSHEGFAVSGVTKAEDSVEVSYTGAATGENEYISAVVTDRPVTEEGASVTYYGRIKNCVDAGDSSGTVTINTYQKHFDENFLYVFNEQCNGDTKTDFSSELKEVLASKTKVSSFIYWQNDGKPDRPEKVNLHLLANGTEVGSADVRESISGFWMYDFEDMPIYDDERNKITYSVEVADVVSTDGRTYQTSVENIGDHGFIIICDLPPRPELTITAKDKTFEYNGETQGPGDAVYSDPAEIDEMVTVSGLKDGDVLSGIQVGGQGKEEGEYDLEPSGAMIGGVSASQKYDVNYVSGKLTITHKLSAVDRVEPTCTKPGTEAHWTCEACGGLFSDAEGKTEITEADTVIEALGHDMSDWEVVKQAKCTETGLEARSCSRGDLEETREIKATGHKYGEPEYNWNEDNTKVTAARTCENDHSHIDSETVDATSEITKPATCTEKGDTTYTSAEFKNEAFAVQEKTVTDIDATGHDYAEPNYVWSDDNKEVTATRVCTHDSSHVKSETVKTTAEVTKEPTCEEMGETTYTATFENEAFRQQEKIVQDGDALGHEYGDELVVDKEPTCTEPGRKSAHCVRCDATKYETEIPATGHEYGDELVVDKEPTCTEPGSKSAHCVKCGATKFKVEIPATGHKYGKWTKLDDEQHQRICEHDAAHVEKEDHTWNQGVVTKQATEKEEGVKTYTCTACKATKEEAIPKNAKVDKMLAINVNSIATGAKMKKKTMAIKWKKVKGAANYKIAYRLAGKKWTEKWTKGKNTITLKKLKKNGLYEFKLMAVKKSGSTWTRSKWSKVNYRFFMNTTEKIKAVKKGARVTVKKVKKGSGYDAQYALKKASVNKGKIKTFRGAKKVKLSIKGLKSKKNYFVRTRPYKTYKGHKYIGIWNAPKKVKTK